MAQGNKLAGALCGHDAGQTRHAEHIALGNLVALDALKNLLANVYFTCGNGNSCGHRLFAHVHHNGVAFPIKMG